MPKPPKPSTDRRKRVLVTGATGKTGTCAASLLLSRGHNVRAFVYRDDDRSLALRAHGAEVVVGDLLDPTAVSSALAGVDTAYFCYPVPPGLVDATAFFAREAREARVAAIVNMSQIPARRNAGSVASRQHWIAEQVLDWSGVPVTHLRPTLFAEWLPRPGASIANCIALSLPFSGSRQRYELAEVGPFAEQLAARTGSAHLGQHVANIALDYRAGIFSGVSDLVERLGKTVPTTVARFVERHRATFRV